MHYEIPSIGVEEEYQLVHPESGELLPNCKQVMQTLRQTGSGDSLDSEIQHELHLNQIEMASDVCHSLREIRDALESTREKLAQAATQNGCRLASAGTNPLRIPDEEALTPKDRYQAMTERFQQIARDLFIFGCHVHVSMDDRELGVAVMNRCRRWLPILQAITANSPFWDGSDTGYASYRRELWAQWPMAGPPPHFDSLDDHQSCVDELIACGAIADESFIYWDIRLPTKVPTIEFRGADVMTRVEETVGYVGLVRAIVMQAVAEEHSGRQPTPIRPNVLSYAIWQAARYGMSGDLVDPATCRKMPALELLLKTMAELESVLDATGEREPVDDYVDFLRRSGTGAERQRVLAQQKDLRGIVLGVVEAT